MTNLTPYYDDGQCVIFHGDCTEIMPTLGHFDVAFADPPYNCGVDYGSGYDDRQDPNVYAIWCSIWFRLLQQHADRIVVTPGHGNLAQWAARHPAGIGVWFKPGNPSGAGIFQFCEWEPVFVWGKGPIGGSDVYRATVTKQRDTGNHPCPKPPLLLRRLLVALKGETVLDPFMGSGTTLRAAKDLGRKAIGIEIEERYCEIAARRLGQEVLAL
jgi:DNA modification methylase